MEYFRSGLKSVLGTPQPGTQPTSAETVVLLILYINRCLHLTLTLVYLEKSTFLTKCKKEITYSFQDMFN